MTEAVRIQTGRNMEWLDVGEMAKRLDRKLGGWANYFKLGPVRPAYRFLDRYTTNRLRRWLCEKHKFDERDVKTGYGLDNEAPANERAGYR
jgi:RNA-directed DNA polymerase